MKCASKTSGLLITALLSAFFTFPAYSSDSVGCYSVTDSNVFAIVDLDGEGKPMSIALKKGKDVSEEDWDHRPQDLAAGDKSDLVTVKRERKIGFPINTQLRFEPNRIGSINLYQLDSNGKSVMTLACRPPEWTPRDGCQNRVSRELSSFEWGSYYEPATSVVRQVEWSHIVFSSSPMDEISFGYYYLSGPNGSVARNWAGYRGGYEINISRLSVTGYMESKTIDLDSVCNYRAVRVNLPSFEASESNTVVATAESCKSGSTAKARWLCDKYFSNK
jgi:hypothetical protein